MKRLVKQDQVIKNTFNKIASRVLSHSALSPNASSLVYITSCNRQQGKSVVSSLLSYYCALISNKKILLIDANMDSPQIASLFGITNSGGLSGLLKSEQTQVDAHSTKLPNLWVLPAGEHADSSSLYMQHRVSKLIESCKQNYDLIIVDSSSVDTNADNSMASEADGVIVVVDTTSTRKADVENLDKDLNIDSNKIIGAILNKHQDYIPNAISSLL